VTARRVAVVALLAAIAFGGAFAMARSGTSSGSSSQRIRAIGLPAASIGAAVTRSAGVLPSLGSVPQPKPSAPAATAPSAPGSSPPSGGSGTNGGSGGSGGSGGIIQG